MNLQAEYARADQLIRAGRLDEAAALLDALIHADPRIAVLYAQRAMIDLHRGRWAAAQSLLERAIDIDRNDPVAFNSLGCAQHELARYEDALRNFKRAIDLQRDYADAYNNRGNTFAVLNRHAEALDHFDRALLSRPNFHLAHYNRARSLAVLGDMGGAIAACQSAIAIEPGFAWGYLQLGATLNAIDRPQEALDALHHAARLGSDPALTFLALGESFHLMARPAEALDALGKALAHNPVLPNARGRRLHMAMRICDWRLFDEDVAAIRDGLKAGQMIALPFDILAAPIGPENLLLSARMQCAQLPSAKRLRVHNRKDRIKIGYFSTDFCQHATAALATGLFEAHDRAAFDVYGILLRAPQRDAMTDRTLAAFEHVVDLSAMSDGRAAERAREIGLDIALDMKGHTLNARRAIFAARAAPIQVNFLGYPGSIGADFVDYIIADRLLIPSDERSFYSEKIVYLPDTYQPNDAKRPVSGRVFTRSELGLPQQGFVFCSFNANYKITPDLFDTWMRLLNVVEGSVLWLLEDSAQAAANLRAQAAQRGVNPARLIFAPRVEMSEHIARTRCADLFLDSFHCNAHTTASDALWVGLPILTRLGDTLAGRVAASVLHAIGLPELVANSTEEYERRALDLALNRDRLTAIKAKLIANRDTHPLFDAARYTGHIEAAYKEMQRRAVAGEAPDHIWIAPNP